MPFNLMKKYPELLELDYLSQKQRKESLRRIFDRDLTNNNTYSYNGKRIYPIKTDGKIDLDREFMHLTTERVKDEQGNDCNVYDRHRSERLHWIRTHIDKNVHDSDIEVFSTIERDRANRVDVMRTYIYNKTRKYVIVLHPQFRNDNYAYYLLTAYYLNKVYGEKEMQKKMKKRMDIVL